LKDNVYKNAMDLLHFSNDLEAAVLEKANQKHHGFRKLRIAVLAAVICLFLGSTVFASDIIAEKALRIREMGRIRSNFSNAEVMEFSVSEHLWGVDAHYMELKPKGHYYFGEGLIYHPTEGFLEVTEDYQLKALPFASLDAKFEKNGRTYDQNIDYVEADGGIYSNYLEFYRVRNDEILVNMTADGSHSWPVYMNIKTGACRDALPRFTEADFLPEKLESGYEARVAYTQPFRDGILVSCLVSGMRNGNSDSTTLHYWIPEDRREVVKLDLPKNAVDYIFEDRLYYQDSEGICYEMDDLFQFRKLDPITKTTDLLDCGLLTACNGDGVLEIIDVINPAIYVVPELPVKENSLWDTTGFNATRHSPDGKIVVTHSYHDYEAYNRPVDSIAYLDMESGELRQLQIDADYRVQTHGWLDDDRYCIFYEDGLKRFLCVYEFEN